MLKGFKRATRRQERAIENGIGYYVHKPEGLYSVSRYVMYNFLKKHFGLTNWQKWDDAIKDDFRDKTQWAYLLYPPHRLLSIEDYKRIYCVYKAFRTVSKNPELLEGNPSGLGDLHSTLLTELQEDVNYFYNALLDFRKSVKGNFSLAKTLHPGFIIINAFQLHFENANYHIHRLRIVKKNWRRFL
ncbi:MAG: hypothetical protein WA941_06090 [Nitrososphaeraceae archaeon]